jgi:hypothetical protein
MYDIIYTPRIHDEVSVARFNTETEAQKYLEKIKEVRPKAYPHHRIELVVNKGEEV